MTEHKFGTWYPIEELKDVYKDVLFYAKHERMVVGSVDEDGVLWNELGSEPLSHYLGYSTITKWMPLPPPPGETND